MTRPIIIKDAPEKFRPFLNAADNYNDSDKQSGAINTVHEAIHALEEACSFSSRQTPGQKAGTCLELADYLQKYAGYKTDGHFLYFRANALFAKGDLPAAAKNFDAIIARGREMVGRAWAGRGAIAYREGKTPLALSHLQKAVEIEPSNSEARHWLIELMMEQNEPVNALKYAEAGLKLAPDKPLAYYSLAMTLRILGRFDEAQSAAERGLKLPANTKLANAYLSCERALSLHFSKKFSEAAAAFRQTAVLGEIELEENYFYNLIFGKTLAMTGEYEDALKLLEKSLGLNASVPDTVQSLVAVSNNLNLWDKSKKYYETGLRMNISNDAFHFMGAIAHFNLSEFDEAIAASEKAVKLNDGNKEYKYLLKIAEGNKALSALNYERAISLFKEATLILPGRVDAYVQLLKALPAKGGGQTPEVEETFKKGYPLCGDDQCRASLKLAFADSLAMSGAYDRALSEIASARETGAGAFDSLILTASILVMSDDLQGAREHLKKAEAVMNPSNQKNAVIAAMFNAFFDSRSDPDKAISTLELKLDDLARQTKVKTGIDVPFVLLAIFKGITAYQRVLNGSIANPEEYRAAAGMLFQASQYNKALAVLDKYIAARPQNPDAHYLRGNILHNLSKMDDAAAEYKMAIDLGMASDAPLRYRYAIALANAGRNEEALRQFDETLGLDPDMKDARVKKCAVAFVNGKVSEASRCVDEAIKKMPQENDAYRLKAEIMLQRGKIKEAMALAKKALELNPKNSPAMLVLAKIHMSKGEYERALELLKTAIELMPYDKNAYILASECMLNLRRFDDLKLLLEKFEAMFPDSKFLYPAKAAIEMENENYKEAARLIDETETIEKGASGEIVKLYQKAQMLAMMGKFSEAEEEMRRVIKSAPESANNNAQFLHDLGKVLSFLDRHKEALEVFRKSERAADSPAGKALAIEGIARTHMALEEYDKALRALDRAAGLKTGIDLRPAKALILMSMGKKKEGIKTADSILQTDPDNPHANHIIAFNLSTQGKFKEALPFSEKAHKAMPYSSSTVATLGFIYSSLGRMEDAAAKFKRVVELDPSDTFAYVGLGFALAKLKRPDEAITYLKIAEEKGVKDPQLFLLAGEVLFDMGNYPEAVAYFDKWTALARAPDDKMTYHQKAGWAQFRMGNYSEAGRHFEKILGAKPDTAAIGYFGLASIAFQEKNPAKAKEYLQDALGMNPNHTGALNELAIMEASAGRMDEALGLFDRAISSDENVHDARYNKAFALVSIGRFSDALLAVDKLLNIARDEKIRADAYFLKAFILSNLGKYKMANEYYDLVLNVKKDMVEARFLKAHALYNMGKFKNAIAELGRIIETNAAKPETYALRGLIYMEEMRDNGKALADFIKYADLDPENPAGHYHKAKALYNLGRYDESLKELNHPAVKKWNYSDPDMLRAMIGLKIKAYDMALEHIKNALNKNNVMDSLLPSIPDIRAEILLEKDAMGDRPPPLQDAAKIETHCRAQEEYCRRLFDSPQKFGNLSYLEQMRKRRDCWNIGKKICNFNVSKDYEGRPSTILPDIKPFKWKKAPAEPPKGMDHNWNMRPRM